MLLGAACAPLAAPINVDMSTPAYSLAQGCESHLDSWCNMNCPHSQSEPLYARFDTNRQGGPAAWRCYSHSTLDRSLTRYVQGEMYCTRHPQIEKELVLCRELASAAFNSELEYGPSGGALPSLVPQTPMPPAGHETCLDTVAECALWAQYNECHENQEYMRTACAASCRSCNDGRAGGAWSTPARVLPHPQEQPLEPPPPPSPPPMSPPPPSEAGPKCVHPCDPANDGTGVASCTGRGRCAPWNGQNWCACKNTWAARRVGLQCEREIGEGLTCPAGCEEHGWCVHGYCECQAGWHGRACTEPGAAATFLTVSALMEAGLVRGRKGSKNAAAAACDVPSYHKAYARNASKLTTLLNSLHEVSPSLGCGSCALVSNAGSLLGQGRGEEIDANDCVWRMNRGPTQGFEKDVGRRTTLDMVNSFPHLRNINILPRKDSHLLHGMTIEPFDPAEGFTKYMGWVSGHASFKEQRPDHEVSAFDVEWLLLTSTLTLTLNQQQPRSPFLTSNGFSTRGRPTGPTSRLG